jgi:hypothetical protein
MALLAPGVDRLEAPQVDHRHLALHHLSMPSPFGGNVRKLLEKAATATPYAEWIERTVVANTKPGELVLIVAHKALFDQERLKRAEKAPRDLEGRQVLTMSWGSGIGSNVAREAAAVFLFHEFYIPRAAVVGTVLGGRDQRFALAEDLKDTQSGAFGGVYHDLREAHLMRWSVQLGARGRMRQVDAEGRCMAMRLYTTMPLDRLLKVRDLAFPTAPLPVVLGLEADQQGDQAPVVNGLVRLLTTEPRGAIRWASELERTIGLRSCDLTRYLKKPTVKPVADAYGWQVVTRKSLGLSGKGQGLRRAA